VLVNYKAIMLQQPQAYLRYFGAGLRRSRHPRLEPSDGYFCGHARAALFQVDGDYGGKEVGVIA
jgi:hypothetical protein